MRVWLATSRLAGRTLKTNQDRPARREARRIDSRLRSPRRILEQSPLRLPGITGDRECCAPAYSEGKHHAPAPTAVVRHSIRCN